MKLTACAHANYEYRWHVRILLSVAWQLRCYAPGTGTAGVAAWSLQTMAYGGRVGYVPLASGAKPNFMGGGTPGFGIVPNPQSDSDHSIYYPPEKVNQYGRSACSDYGDCGGCYTGPSRR